MHGKLPHRVATAVAALGAVMSVYLLFSPNPSEERIKQTGAICAVSNFLCCVVRKQDDNQPADRKQT